MSDRGPNRNHERTSMEERSKTRIGVIGIGAMGMGIARNLHARGYPMTVRDIRSEAEREAADCGMRVASSPRELARLADCIVVVVLDASQIDEVLFGAEGVVQAGQPGLTVVLSSTIAPEDTVRFAGRLAEHGIACIDAPISGGPAKAEAGTMSMMLAAPTALLDRFEPLFSDMSGVRFRISEKIGDGARAKLVNNLLAGINLVAGAEALALAARMGLNTRRIFDVICASSGHSWVFADRMARALNDDYAPRAFAHILTKDVTLATGMADSVGYETPLGDAALAVYRETLDRGWSSLDDAAVLKTYFARNA